jgi:bifunctional DNA primase/polymerase-like protein
MTAAPKLKLVRWYDALINTAWDLRFSSDQGIEPHCIPACGTDKRPLLKDWPKLATPDPEKLAQLFERSGERATLLGVATGPKSGFFGIDVDRRNGGDASIAALQERHGNLPETCTYDAPNGPRSCFKWPAGVTLPKRPWRTALTSSAAKAMDG